MSAKTLNAFILSIAVCAAGAACAQTPAPTPTPAAEPAPPATPASQEPKKDAPAAVDTMEVKGRNDAVDQRRNSTASKIIITKEDIQQFGDSNIADVMRRLPGVTQSGRPGRGGRPAMRGMGGGFTQILIDGQSIPPGFGLDQLSPEQVERIEILRAPTAETGARAIAGTINIILREPLRRTDSELQLGVSNENGAYPANISFVRNGVLGENITWTLSANGNMGSRNEESQTLVRNTDLITGKTTLDQRFETTNDNNFQGAFLNARANWRIGQGETFGLMMYAGSNSPHNTWHTDLTQTVGDKPAQYAFRDGRFDGRFEPSRINVNLNKKWDNETRYELRAGVGAFTGNAHSRTQDTLADGSAGLVSSTDTISRDASWSFSAKLMHTPAGGTHNLTSGFEFETTQRKQTSVTLNNGVQQLADLGEEFKVGSGRFAIYAQDEWDLNDAWGANLGIRYETIRTKSLSGEDDASNTSKVLTPLGHLLYRLGDSAPGGRRDQIRLSLTQSYRSPNNDQLIARPSLNTTYPVPGPNTFTSPDRAGNVNLKPERANGIDLAYENYFKGGGVFSVNLFHRQIQDLIRNVTALENVSWAKSPRYVSRPQNFSEAFSQGLEMDVKVGLKDLFPSAPAINVRANASLFRSEVKDVPGPDNRINEQPKWTANFGGDYRIPNTPIQLGGNYAYTPGFNVQLTDVTAQTVNMKRVFDLFAVYTVDAFTKVRFTASNVSAHPTETLNTSVVNQTLIESTNTAQNYRNFGIRLEMRF